jgi:hypothetical protein
MNYYKANSVFSIAPEFSKPILIHGWHESYFVFTDKAHNSLERCKECGLKYDFHNLIRTDVGVFVCKFCLKGAA